MVDVLETGSNWLHQQQKQFASRAVTYQRGALQTDVHATIGRTIFEIDNGYGVLERTESRDFLVLAADLVLGGQQTLPERGDRVRESDGTKTFVYEVMAPGKEPHYRYSDPYRKALRIHTKHVETEDA